MSLTWIQSAVVRTVYDVEEGPQGTFRDVRVSNLFTATFREAFLVSGPFICPLFPSGEWIWKKGWRSFWIRLGIRPSLLSLHDQFLRDPSPWCPRFLSLDHPYLKEKILPERLLQRTPQLFLLASDRECCCLFLPWLKTRTDSGFINWSSHLN